MRVDLTAVLAVISLAIYVLAGVISVLATSLLGLSGLAWFAIATAVLILALILRPRRPSHA